MLRTLGRQSPQQRVTDLGDAQLRRTLARFPLLGSQSDIATHITAFQEPVAVIIQKQHERQCGYRTNAINRSNGFRLRVLTLGFLNDQLLVRLNLSRQLLDHSQKRQQRRRGLLFDEGAVRGR